MYDIIVIGGGPAGLTAALYARRANKSVLVIEKNTFGGQITYSPKVENYPAFESISGRSLPSFSLSSFQTRSIAMRLRSTSKIAFCTSL